MSKCTYPSRSCDGILKQVMVILYQVDVHERHRRAAEMISAKSRHVLIFERLSLQIFSEIEKKMPVNLSVCSTFRALKIAKKKAV